MFGLPDIQQFLLKGSKKSYKDYGASISGAELLSIFFLNSYGSIADEVPPSLDSVLIKALFDAAHKGFTPAQAVVSRVLTSYKLPWPSGCDQSLKITWLVNGASSGSMIVTKVLQEVDDVLAEKALVSFREGGGYQKFYSTEERRQEWNRAMDDLLTRGCAANATINAAHETPNGFDVSSANEEGYIAIHRLQYNRLGRTFRQDRFWSPAFSGPPSVRRLEILRTIQTLQSMGANIDALTSPHPDNPRRKTEDNQRPGTLTPLMLAVRHCDLDAVISLLSCGANPNVRNNLGLNALCLLPESGDSTADPAALEPIVETLIKHGADIRSHSDWTPLSSAIYSGNLKVTGTLLHYAALSILPRVAEFLVTRYADDNARRESQPGKIVNSKGNWRVMKKVERIYQIHAVSSAG
ncbi:hypothetical protein K440DRAFT_641899 [Wilcoxina mikolae CBS 423.85]|nr:hypothetical protein K440DRAFT_641899 [Wilcoxina mikolae CBS 423.85]